MNRAICYVRVSTEEQAREGVSIAAQTERLRAYCHMAGLEIVDTIRDEGVSGAKPLASRDGGQRLIELLAKGQAQHVVALKLDRLFRDAEDALRQTRAWDKARIALHLVDMGGTTLNTASAMGRFFLSMLAAFAELERNLIAERTALALRHKKAHLEAYAPEPYGYKRVEERLIRDAKEQGVLAQIFGLRQAGRSLRDIAATLNVLGIPTKRGARWYASTIHYLLRNDLYQYQVKGVS